MKHYIAASVATTLLASSAMASGLDRTGQPIGLIFEEGTYAEFSFATTDVEGRRNVLCRLEDADITVNT